MGMCQGCPGSWTGALTCHCGSCHRTFTGSSAFDEHIHYDKCRDPLERGLILREERPYECYGWVEDRDYSQLRK